MHHDCLNITATANPEGLEGGRAGPSHRLVDVRVQLSGLCFISPLQIFVISRPHTQNVPGCAFGSTHLS